MFFAFDPRLEIHLQVHVLVVGGPGETTGGIGFALIFFGYS